MLGKECSACQHQRCGRKVNKMIPISHTSGLFYCTKWYDKQLERVQPGDIPVGPRGWMLGQERDEVDHASRQSGYQEQERIQAVIMALPLPFAISQQPDDKQQRIGANRRREPFRRRFFGRKGFGDVRFLYQGPFVPLLVDEHGRGHGLLQVVGEEHHLVRRSDAVGRASQDQVTSERQPGMVSRAMVDHLAESLLRRLPPVFHFSPHVGLDQPGRPRGAIIKEEIVAVDAVLRLVVLEQRAPDTLHLDRRTGIPRHSPHIS